MKIFLSIFIGGGLGSLLRYAISQGLGKHQSGFPSGTFAANILSCIVLGLAYIYFEKKVELDPALKLMVMVGFCGGFSTFSTFSLETFKLLEEGKILMAFAYVIFSVAACLAVLALVFGVKK